MQHIDYSGSCYRTKPKTTINFDGLNQLNYLKLDLSRNYDYDSDNDGWNLLLDLNFGSTSQSLNILEIKNSSDENTQLDYLKVFKSKSVDFVEISSSKFKTFT